MNRKITGLLVITAILIPQEGLCLRPMAANNHINLRIAADNSNRNSTEEEPRDDDFEILNRISSKMSLEEIRACIKSMRNIKIQDKIPGMVSPYWGLFGDVRLPQKYMERIEEAVYLRRLEGKLAEEKLIIPLNPKDYYQVNGRWVRAIKIKGISPRVARIKRADMRHIRLRGPGDIPSLIPIAKPDGKLAVFLYEVGEPYGAKRFRSAINEVVHTRYLFSKGCSVLVPMGIGIYEDPELLYKGETIAFSIFGVEHPEDLRFGEEADDKQKEMFKRLSKFIEEDKLQGIWGELEKLIIWRRKRYGKQIRELRQDHNHGVVHNEPHANNAQFFRGSLTWLDYEEAANRFNLTKEQFLEAVLAELHRIISRAYSLDNNGRALLGYLRKQPELKDILPERFPPVDFFACYFSDEEMSPEDRKRILRLQPYNRYKRIEREAFQKLIYQTLVDIFGKGSFGKGVDWEDYARPFKPGFSATEPVWQPETNTSFDPIMFVPYGEDPFAKKRRHPSRGIRRAEEAIYEGRFEDAARIYENILSYGHRRNRKLDTNIHHNLAALYLALRRDDKAREHFELGKSKARADSDDIRQSSLIISAVASAA